MNCIGVPNLPQSERMQTYSLVSKRRMKVRPIDANVSNTLIGKSKNTIIQPLMWPIPKRIGKYSAYAKPINENLANKQLKSHWNNIDWKAVETHVNRLQVRITKAVFKGKWNLVKRLCIGHRLRSYFLLLILFFGADLIISYSNHSSLNLFLFTCGSNA